MAKDLRDHLFGELGFQENLDKYLGGELPAPRDNPSGPHVCKVWFSSPMENGRRPVAEMTISGLTASNKLTEDIHEKLAEVYGWDPTGTVEISLYKPGDGAKPAVRMQRKCTAAEMDADGPSTALLKSLLAAERNRNNEHFAIQSNTIGHLSAALAASNGHLSALATARGGASAASDLSGPWAIVGLGVLVLAYPSLKTALGLPKNADLMDTATRIRAFFTGIAKKNEDAGGLPFDPPPLPSMDAPPGLLADQDGDDDGTPATRLDDGPASETVPAEGDPLEALDPRLAKWLVETAAKLTDDPDGTVRMSIVSKALEAGVDHKALLAVQSAFEAK